MIGRVSSIYLDYAATTPCDQRVVNEMLPYFTNIFGNSNSLHVYGQEALSGLSKARERIASLINSGFEEVIFTSGSTESNGIVCNNKKVATTKTEHKSMFDACVDPILLNVDHSGMLKIDELKSVLSSQQVDIVSVCFINNETGVIQHIKEIADISHEYNALFHTDATQALGKVPINVADLGIDFMSASAHKIYGPKGVGMLYCNKKHHRLLRKKNGNKEIEFGIRPGTVPVPLCIGFGAAAFFASSEMFKDYSSIKNLRDILVNGIVSQLDEIYINGSGNSNYPGIVNISFRGCEGEALMMETPRICVSSGSACTSNILSISHVLDAMGIAPDIAQSSIRISIGKDTTIDDITIAVEDLVAATKKLRSMSPVWDMIKSGINIDEVFIGEHGHEI